MANLTRSFSHSRSGSINEVVIVDAVRTPIGSFQGSLSSLSATQLGGIAVKALIDRTGVAVDSIDEVFMGNVISAGLGQAPARQAAIFAGIFLRHFWISFAFWIYLLNFVGIFVCVLF